MSKDSDYIEPVKAFKTRTLISLANYDMSVPFGSSSIRSFNPYTPPPFSSTKFSLLGAYNFSKEMTNKLYSDVKNYDFDEKYLGDDNGNEYYCDNVKHVEYNLETYKNLNKIEWRRLDIEFQIDSSHRAFTLHDLVIFKESKTHYLLTDELKKVGMELQDKIYELFDYDLNN